MTDTTQKNIGFRASGLLLLLVYMILLPEICGADYRDDIGYTRLQAELGALMPDGHIVAVTQAEAEVWIDHDKNPDTPQVKAWVPDPANPELAGKEIEDKSYGQSGVYSGHATGVGARLSGVYSSIAPGIHQIDSYSQSHWQGWGLLFSEYTYQPYFCDSRVANHSWISTTGGSEYTSNILRRVDWIIEIDEFIQSVANCSANAPLLGNAYNVISVGRTDAAHAYGSVSVDGTYGIGRTKPDIVVPQSSLSAATPVVAAAAALLVEAGNDPALTSDPAEQYTQNRNGDIIYNAGRAEVIKAVIMAGADRITHNQSDVDLVEYRVDTGNQTANGLDRRYGAGQLNVYNSYQILSAGEQNSLEDEGAEQGEIGYSGFDYDPAFGGLEGSNQQASYFFAADENYLKLWASLVWHIDIDGGGYASFDGTATLVDMDISLYDVTAPENPVLVDNSEGSTDNTENLWVALTQGHRYMIAVTPGSSQPDFKWDFALAWRIEQPYDTDLDDVPDEWDAFIEDPAEWLDTDADGIGNNADDDDENDGMPDAWEILYALDPLVNDAHLDEDNDGISNLEEYQSGTDPLRSEDIAQFAVPVFNSLIIMAATAILMLGIGLRKMTGPQA